MSLARNLQRFLDDHQISYRSGRRAFVTACLSPSCGKEDHCYIWKKDGGAICFRCGRKWRWQWVVASIGRCSPEDAYEKLFGTGAGEQLHQKVDFSGFCKLGIEDPEREEELPILLGPDFVPVVNSERGLLYLIGRGVDDPKLIEDYDIRYHAMMDAVVFPIKRHPRVFGWQARRIDPKEGELRLISHTSFYKSRFLLNWDTARKFEKVVLVEGPFDCLHVDIRDHGYSAVASLGKGVSADQIKLILDMPAKEFYLGLDPDACLEVYDVVSRIGLGKNIFRIWPPKTRGDFGECTKEETLESLAKALPVSSPGDFMEVYLKR